MYNSILLEKEQKELLIALVEAARNVPKDKREKFTFHEDASGESWVTHGGFKNWSLDLYKGDLEILVNCALLNPTYTKDGLYSFDINPEGFQYYNLLKKELADPINRVEESIKSYLFSFAFQAKYPNAYNKWKQAEEILWSTETQQQLTAIGHHCREAVQEFATSLVERYQIKDTNQYKAHHISRLKSVIASLRPQLGTTIFPFLESLINYWGCLSDLIQRQEHGIQKEGNELVWNDARRIVFHSAILMSELDETLNI